MAHDKKQPHVKKNGQNNVKEREQTLDEASDESFPASDPPSWISHDVPPKKDPSQK